MYDSFSRNDVFSTVCQIVGLYGAEFCGRQFEKRRWNISRSRKKRVKVETCLKPFSFQFRSSGIFYVTRSSAYRVYKRVCRKIVVHLFLLLSVFKQSLATNGQYMDILLYQEQSPSVFRYFMANGSNEETQRVYFIWKYRWHRLTNFGSTVNGTAQITNPLIWIWFLQISSPINPFS